MAETAQSFIRKLDRLETELSADAQSHAIGQMAKKAAQEAAVGDLGPDGRFSGWRRNDPFELATRYDIIGPGKVSFHPSKRGAGPWTVAEYGRRTGTGPSLAESSLTPTARTSKRRKRRNNGRTAGKATASDALALIEKRLPKLVDGHVGRAIRKIF